MKASAIQVLMIQSDEIKLPADFQLSLYENLIQQLQKQGGFQHVYRDGDRNAASGNGPWSYFAARFAGSRKAARWHAM